MAVDVVVGLDRLGAQVVIIEVAIGIAVDVGREKDARPRVAHAQARILLVVDLHLQDLELIGQLFARLRAIVLDQQIEVALVVLAQVMRLTDLTETHISVGQAVRKRIVRAVQIRVVIGSRLHVLLWQQAARVLDPDLALLPAHHLLQQMVKQLRIAVVILLQLVDRHRDRILHYIINIIIIYFQFAP